MASEGRNTETLVCAHCGQSFRKEVGQANRQRRVLGNRVRFFCTQQCFGASRTLGRSKAQRAEEKAAYDREYRTAKREVLKAKKHEYFCRTYDPATAREARKQSREWHRVYSAEYRRRPEWRAHKEAYDRDRRAAEFGTFAECYALVIELEKEIRRQPWYERAKERGYYDNNRTTNQRKRNEQISRR